MGSDTGGVERLTGAAEEEDLGRDMERRAIAAAKAGSWDGLHYLYARYADDVQRMSQSIVRNRHDAEDVTQEVFVKLMRAIRKYEEREVPFAAWILRRRNASLDHVRSRRQIPVEEVRISENGQEQTAFEYTHALRTALAELPESQREVLVLRHIGGLSPNEIAERLGKTEASVQGLHHRGRAALKAALREQGVAPVIALSALDADGRRNGAHPGRPAS